MKTYKIIIDKREPYPGSCDKWHISFIQIGIHTANLGAYSSRRDARKCAKDFIKQIKEAEEQK